MQSDLHRASFAPYPLALISIALGTGILIARCVAVPLKIPAALTCVTIAFIAWAFRKRSLTYASVLILLAVIFAGVGLGRVEQRRAASDHIKQLLESGAVGPAEPVELTGVIERPLEMAPELSYLTVGVEKIRLRGFERAASGTVELLAPARSQILRDEYDSLDLHFGARIRVMTQLERGESYRNPGVSSFTEYLERKGYDATGIVKSPLLIERLEDKRVFLPLAWVYAWHGWLEREFAAHFPPETAGVLDAALLGNRRNLSHEAAERFRQGGTFHILVINGLHITFIGGLVMLVVRRLTRKRGWQFVLAAVCLWSYALAVGAQAAVVRASIMFTLVALAPLVVRRANSLNALGGAALFLLVWHPADLFDPSFQLTCLSVLAIVVIAVPLLRKLSMIGSWQPTRETPQPPLCAPWLRKFCEVMFWSERGWKRELAHSNHSYRLFKSPWAGRLERYHLQRLLRHATNAVVISASVQLGMLPFLIIYFHRVAPAALILNIWTGALMALLGITALAATLISQISPGLAMPLLVIANTTNSLMVHSVDLFAPLGASFRLPGYTGAQTIIYGLYYLPLGVLTVALSRWNPLRAPQRSKRPKRSSYKRAVFAAAVAQLILLLVILFHPLSAARPDGRLRIDFLDVGQGDSALITAPDGTTLLIDGGGRAGFQNRGPSEANDAAEPFERDSRSIGEAVVSEYLWWRGLDEVDYILATHADADHIDGLNDVARNFKVRSAFVARTPANDPEYATFAATLAARRIPLQIIGSGDLLRFGSLTIRVLWPMLKPDVNAPSKNNDSVVLRLEFGERKIIMTGDLEKEGEAAILRDQKDLRSDVIKVAHHGSKTSSTAAFIAAVRPQLAVISVGLTSMFGHPAKDVVDRWHASGAEVMTTGQRGTITVTTDGHDLKVSTFVN